jgi:hypothetical protein
VREIGKNGGTLETNTRESGWKEERTPGGGSQRKKWNAGKGY